MSFSFNSIVQNVENFILELGQHHPAEIMVILFLKGGWVVFVIVIIRGLWWVYVDNIQNKYAASIKWALLAIDIPKENLQAIKAVEHLFAAMWPFYESKNLVEKYVYGMFQQAFSLEIVSIGGYTQFLIRVPVTHKDIVEAAIYAQYPKAEIAEVEDYALRYKDLRFPSEEYDLWGSEFTLIKPSPYPIKTYPSFEDSLTQTFADPMASMMEVFNKINKDEELWFQLVITPIKDKWKEAGYKIINKMIGAKEKAEGKGILTPFYYFFTLIQEMIIYGLGYEPGEEGKAAQKDSGVPNKMLYLTPEERNVVDGITMKISKIAYQTKLRIIYLGKKGKLVKPKGAGASIGMLQQFSAIDLNSFTPIMKTMTKANYFFVKRRIVNKQNNILRNFRNRSQTGGWGSGFILNIEELATIFHFPVPEALREGIKRVDSKKEAPPVDLPDTIFEDENIKNDEDYVAIGGSSAKVEPPSNLPV
ncbi:hypothetical protein GYA54_00545 [Candidatus Kuenenbacteria bacterium]|nr:hypothetical protein [Candidatus Kuenenbacteria bacterium]